MSLLNRRQFLQITAGAGIATTLSPCVDLLAAGGTTLQLPIPRRRQWDENNGYCGECSIQSAALYFGAYVSQYACRSIVNTNQRTEVLVGVNEQQVLTALRFNSAAYNYNQATPQFQNYFGWLKQHLSQKHPVMIVAYVRGLSDPDYDHIMLATGFSSTDSTTYHASDYLYFNDHFSSTLNSRLASTLSDTRRMRGNGRTYEYCIPTNVDYGCAITGIQDASGAALPVQVQLNSWTEPDVIAGAAPQTLSATVNISGLTVGKSYSLYRYNDYRKVPTQNYATSAYSSVVNFVATSTTATSPASILSNGMAIFRCLPAGL